jgi:hypothetical protein
MYCGSLGFEAENRGNESQSHYGTMCCNKGKLMFEELPELPPTLHRLFTSDDRDAQHFRKNIRQFNAGMAMASFQANNKTVRGGAPAAFKVVGQVYRRIGDALAQHNREAKCLQVYFLDPDYQALLRASRYKSEGRRQNPMDESIFRLLKHEEKVEKGWHCLQLSSLCCWGSTKRNPIIQHISSYLIVG